MPQIRRKCRFFMIPPSLLMAVVILPVAAVGAQQACVPNYLTQSFNNPAPETADAMGYSVAISGNLIVAGAPYDSPGGVSNAGSAYVFDATTGNLVATLNNPDPTVDDNFGWSVAIEGNTAVVGAWQDDPAGPIPAGAGVGAPVTNAGAVYVFDATTGALLRTLTKTIPLANDFFGHGVAISGGRVIVGAPGESQYTGAAYIFDAATGNLTATLTKPAPATAESFGWALDIDGDLAVVGAYLVNVGGAIRVGEAYVYNAGTGALVSTLLDPEPDQDDYFAMSVAILGNTILAGAYDKPTGGIRTGGIAYIFDAATGAHLRTFTAANAEIDSQFGSSVAIEGNLGAIGGYGYTRQITIFDVADATALGTIDPPPIWFSEGGFFGDAVAISGGLIATGSHQEDLNNAGRAYVYGCPPPPTETPTQSPSPTPTPSGTPTPVRTPTPSPTATANPCSPDTPLQALIAPSPTEYAYFGDYVALSGTTALIGAFGQSLPLTEGGQPVYGVGEAYLVNAETGQFLATLSNPLPGNADYFGSAVAIDRNFAVVGASYDGPDVEFRPGSAFVFDVPAGNLVSTLVNPLGGAGDAFGAAAGIFGSTVIVGAPGSAPNLKVYQSGRAYLFDGPTGNLLSVIENPSGASGDNFGYAVGISGNLAIVGAPYTDILQAAAGIGSSVGDAGAAYIYDAATGDLATTLVNPEPSFSDQFGYAVAIYGNLAIVGAPGDRPGGIGAAGSAYVFDATSGALVATLQKPAPTDNDEFGRSVGIFGTTAVVGATLYGVGTLEGAGVPLAGVGGAYVFDAQSGQLKTALSNPEPAEYDLFGHAVAISGNIVLAGSGAEAPGGITYQGGAYSFSCGSVQPTPTPTASPTPASCVPDTALRVIANPDAAADDRFGWSSAISGNLAVVGVPYDDPSGLVDAGAAYVVNAVTGTLVATLNNPSPVGGGEYGYAVAISGNLAVVGAYRDDPGGMTDAGAAYVFNATTGGLVATLNNPAPAANDAFGYAVGIDANLVVVGAYGDDPGGVVDAGTAYVFNAATGALVATLNNPDPAYLDRLGVAVAISGNVVVASAHSDDPGGVIDAGTVYTFNATTGAVLATLNNPAPAASDFFGYAVGISGNTAIVGSPYSDPGAVQSAGTAYLFDATTGDLAATLNNPAPGTNNYMGESVTISENVAVAGARGYSSGGMIGEGKAYVFDATTGAFAATLNNPEPTAWDEFGISVAVSGEVAIVGTTGNSPCGQQYSGSAYAFTCAALVPNPTASPTACETPAPTATPSSTPSPVGTPVISFDIVIGYRPANDHGRGFVQFTDSDPSPDLRSYVVEFRRTNRFGVIFEQAFSLDGPPSESETRSTEFNLPLNTADNPLSYEADLQYRVVGFTGQNGTGIGLYQSQLAYAKVPSATLDSSITLTAPPIAPGSEPFSMSDARPTGQIGTLQYDIVRTVPGIEGETVLATLDHGYPGPAIVAKVWPAVTRTGTLAVIGGTQVLTIHARHDYLDSAGGPLGRYDVAPPSPPLVLGDIGVISARIAEHLRTGAGDTTGLDLNGDSVVDVADLLVGLAGGL